MYTECISAIRREIVVLDTVRASSRIITVEAVARATSAEEEVRVAVIWVVSLSAILLALIVDEVVETLGARDVVHGAVRAEVELLADCAGLVADFAEVRVGEETDWTTRHAAPVLLGRVVGRVVEGVKGHSHRLVASGAVRGDETAGCALRGAHVAHEEGRVIDGVGGAGGNT